jgi:hypothetical protein
LVEEGAKEEEGKGKEVEGEIVVGKEKKEETIPKEGEKIEGREEEVVVTEEPKEAVKTKGKGKKKGKSQKGKGQSKT